MSSSNSKTLYAVVCIVVIAVGAVGAYMILVPPAGLPDNPYDVAIVFATGGLGDKSFNDAAYKGAMDAMEDYGTNFTFVEPTEITEYEGFLRTYAAHAEYADPYDLIIGIGFDQADGMMVVANETPNQYFAIVDMFIDPGTYPNVTSILFNEHEGSALVGAIAGLTTTTNKIGFVGGLDIPLINKFAGGYVFGANYSFNHEDGGDMGADINYTIAYTNDWVDTTAGQNLADGMIAAGADIIFGAAGRAGLGVWDSVKANNATSDIPLWAIGVDSPQMYLGCADPANPAPPTVGLTSMLKKVDLAVYRAVQSVLTDTFGGIAGYSLANGGLGFELNEDLLTLSPDIVDFTNALKLDIVAGNVVVPDTKYWLP
ncbi:MAG: BMP family lipoprotein [Candidatus Thorarchaeota archaeon]|jgi:basic membrane protein A